MKTASYPAASDTSGKAAALGDKPTFAAAADKLGSKPNEQSRQSSAWTFWTKERDSTTSTNDTGNSSQGKLAVAGSPSESRPEAASVDVSDETTAGAIRPAKRGRPVSLETTEESPLRTDPSYSTPKMTPSHSPAPAKTKLTGPSVKQQLQKSLPANLLLPSFKNTYHLLESPSILQQIARLLHYHKQSPAQHVHLIRQPQRIKRALAIGIHGYFPAPLLRSVLGQPTGTSIRFATSAAEAIRKWTANQGYDCEIEKVALEGEGRIGERVDILWKLVLNWIDRIQKADFVLFACHSQGVPVTMILVAKLIEFGCLSSARVGVCAMAGVNLGPFPEYKSRLFSGSAGELFEFANPASAVAQRYVDALRIAVQHGVRVVYVGSIDDQLVSLESSTFSTVNHPYIYRAVFVDGRVHAPDFITHLVGFALKLRNLGFSDHGLIRELSAPLAGSLYSGEGHSRLYEDDIAYSLAVEHALETTSVGDVALQVQKYEVPAASNPFILPWSMRGLLEEDYVRTELSKEMTELLQQFDAWKPNSKVLKDVKFRLEAVKSKL
ncbi:MAG: hypothetical protein M1817_005624 [Caeruleum heppii]|nr:MAG: hypothetical protein M1817_005624 [Caeruleum heppii]